MYWKCRVLMFVITVRCDIFSCLWRQYPDAYYAKTNFNYSWCDPPCPPYNNSKLLKPDFPESNPLSVGWLSSLSCSNHVSVSINVFSTRRFFTVLGKEVMTRIPFILHDLYMRWPHAHLPHDIKWQQQVTCFPTLAIVFHHPMSSVYSCVCFFFFFLTFVAIWGSMSNSMSCVASTFC